MNMNLKGIMQTLGAQPGQVVSNPYVRAFAPTSVVKEETITEEDHEVSMAQNQLDSIIKAATELKNKIGEGEKDIPAWIQDHITNSENYINQAATNYHEYGNESVNEVSYNVKADNAYQFINGATAVLGMYSRDEKLDSGVKHTLQKVVKDLEGLKRYFFNRKDESLNEEFKHIISVDTPTQVVSKPIAAQIEKLARQGVRSKEIGLKMGFVGNQKAATDAFQKLKNQIYFKLHKNESINEARLTDIVNSIVETPVIGKMVVHAPSTTQVTEAKKYDVGAGFMGNGLTIWNRAEEENRDYRIIAHIDPYGKISIRDKEIPSDVMKMIKDWAEAIKKGDK
jgi:hypothetical protein